MSLLEQEKNWRNILGLSIKNMSDELKISKTCKKCQTEKPLDQFRAHPKTKDLKKTECIPCDDARQKEYYLKHKKKIIKGVLKNRKLKNKAAKTGQNPAISGNENLQNTPEITITQQ